MKKNYARSLKIILGYEGGNVDDPKDNGGRTSRGVTQRVYSGYRAKMGKPAQDVYRATDAEVAYIYKHQYWDVCKADELPNGIDLVAFNAAVNSGPKRAYKMLQASLNIIASTRLMVDGTPGMVTVAAAQSAPDHDAVIVEFGRKYQAFYRSLSSWRYFGVGWTRRNRNVTKIGNAWATGTVGPQPIVAATLYGTPSSRVADGSETPNAYMNIKARDEDISQEYVGTGGSTTITAGSFASTGGLEQIQQQVVDTSSTLEPLSYMIDYVQYALVLLALVGVSLGFYAAYKQYKRRRIHNGVESADIPEYYNDEVETK